jgi:hypothetical protein
MGHTLICQKLLLVGNHNVPFAECASAMRLVEKAACFFVGMRLRSSLAPTMSLYTYQTFVYNNCFL